jgi:hypothetical protein
MKDTPQQTRLRDVCRYLLANGVKPTPTVLETFESSFVTRKGKNITLSHGRLGKVRREELVSAGWHYVEHKFGGLWHPPLIKEA